MIRIHVLLGTVLGLSCSIRDPYHVDNDASVAVDALVADARPLADARPDAANVGPIVQDGQPAELVLGQADFTSSTVVLDPLTKSLSGPSAMASNSDSLWIFDSGHGRVLRWSPVPNSSFVAADMVVGKSSLQDTTIPTTITGSNIYNGNTQSVAVALGKLVVTDAIRNRILIWTTLPTVEGQGANIVLGQSNFTTGGSGTGASQLYFPKSIWTDGMQLVVADTSNRRVLIWQTFPTSNGQPADVVIGQTDFGSSMNPLVPSPGNLKTPIGVYFDGTRLYVADASYNRVMVWQGMPDTNGQFADYVIGQGTFDTSSCTTLSPESLCGPAAMVVHDDTLFVSQTQTSASPSLIANRISVFAPIPTESGESASYVLGKPDLTSTENAPTAQDSLMSPRGMAIVGDKLFVADVANNRVLRYDLNLP